MIDAYFVPEEGVGQRHTHVGENGNSQMQDALLLPYMAKTLFIIGKSMGAGEDSVCFCRIVQGKMSHCFWLLWNVMYRYINKRWSRCMEHTHFLIGEI